MRKKNNILYILVILIFNACFNNEQGAEPKDVFIKYYTNHKKCTAVDFTISKDNKYVLLGTTTEKASENIPQGVLLIITNDEGNETNSKIFNYKKDQKDTPSKIIQTKDGGYVILSHTEYNTDQTNIVIWKLKNDFSVLDTIQITTKRKTQITPVQDIATDIVETETQNEFIISGYTNNTITKKEYNKNEDLADVIEIVLKIKAYSSNKNDTSKYKIDTTWRGEGKNDMSISTIYKGNYRMLLFGNTESYRASNSKSNIFYYNVIAKNNPSIGRYIFETEANETMNSVYEIAENNYNIFGNKDTIIGTNTFKIPFLLSTQTEKFTYINTFHKNGYFEVFDTYKTSDLSYILAGKYTYSTQSNENNKKTQMCFFKINAIGNVHPSFISYIHKIATPKFVLGNEGNDVLVKVKEVEDQRIVLLGTFDYGNENPLLILIKTNRYGDMIK